MEYKQSEIVVMRDRSTLIDIMKGILILLVVVGHVIQFNNYNNFDNNIIFRFIYSFHMPAFFVVSGFLFGYSKCKDKIFLLLCNNTFRLVIPFITWYVIKYIIDKQWVNYTFFNFIKLIIKSPDNGLWFLWVLFVIRVIFILLKKISNKLHYNELMIIIIFSLLIILLKPVRVLGIDLVKTYYTYFCLGYIANKEINIIKKININNKMFKYSSIVIFIIAAMQWNRTGAPFFYNENLNGSFGVVYKIIVKIYNIITALLGSLFIFFISDLVVKKNKTILKSLSYLGKNTLGIYAIHFYLVDLISTKSLFLNYILNFCISISLSIIIIKIIKRYKVLSLILLGERGN
jgi:fucose 4-O-acetylase-like acetyltransferase